MGCGADSPQKRCRYGSFCCDNPPVRNQRFLTAPFTQGGLCGRSMSAPTFAPGVRRWMGGFSPPVKNQRFLTAPSSEGAFGCGAKTGGATGEWAVFGTGNPSPTRRTGGWADLPQKGAGMGGFTATIPQSASLTAPFTQGSLGALPRQCENGMLRLKTREGGRSQIAPTCAPGGCGGGWEVFGTGDPSPTRKTGVRQRIGRRQKDLEHGRSPYHNL